MEIGREKLKKITCNIDGYVNQFVILSMEDYDELIGAYTHTPAITKWYMRYYRVTMRLIIECPIWKLVNRIYEFLLYLALFLIGSNTLFYIFLYYKCKDTTIDVTYGYKIIKGLIITLTVHSIFSNHLVIMQKIIHIAAILFCITLGVRFTAENLYALGIYLNLSLSIMIGNGIMFLLSFLPDNILNFINSGITKVQNLFNYAADNSKYFDKQKIM